MLRFVGTARRRRPTLLVASTLVCCLAVGVVRSAGQRSSSTTIEEVLLAQERRASSDGDLERLLRATRLPDAGVQVLAVRALGRLERPGLVASIVPLLDDPDSAMRAEAANAIGQSVDGVGAAAAAGGVSGATMGADETPLPAATRALATRLDVERNDRVRGVICATLGRLPIRGPALAQVEQTLVRESTRSQPVDHAAAVAGAAEGLEWLLRSHAKDVQASAATIEALRAIVASSAHRSPSDAADWTRARRLALLALTGLPRGVPVGTLASLIEREGDGELRRLAVRAAGQGLRSDSADERPARRDLLRRASDDPSPLVRYEALAASARDVPPLDCRPFLAAVGDPSPHVSLLAIDTLARCGRTPAVVERLTASARALGPRLQAWHKPAHAMVALARVAPDVARPQLGRFVTSRTWQVRAYAARAAAILRDGRRLRRLAEDVNDNVRTAAVTGLAAVEQHGADDVYLAQLKRNDYELLMTAARALKGTALPAPAVRALGQALLRLTDERRDTSRDPRLAIIERLAELGSPDAISTLEPLTRDFDPRVASAAVDACRKLSPGGRFEPAPAAPLAFAPLVVDEVRGLDGARAIVRLKTGRTFEMTLWAWDAPATVSRFARLARSGYYNGLTFHRIAPNFVVQGGSPGANEFAGDATYWRDEVGLRSNERGTVGLSTRGRDTGDGQVYVNLVDNFRLDHTYTVFARVSRGMEVVDGIVEGDAIDSIRIEERPGSMTTVIPRSRSIGPH